MALTDKELIDDRFIRNSHRNVWSKASIDWRWVVMTCQQCEERETLKDRSMEYITEALKAFTSLHSRCVKVTLTDDIAREFECIHGCGTKRIVVVSAKDWDEFNDPNRTRSMQEIFRQLDADDREMIISQTCPTCWDEMFTFKDE